MDIFENQTEITHYTSHNIWGDRSIDFHFRQKIQRNKSGIGLIGYSVCQDQMIQLKYTEIQSVVDNIAKQLMIFGLQTGDIFAMQLPNSIETQILYMACWQQGIIVAPLPSLWREEDVEQALIRISPQALICPIIHDAYSYDELMYKIGLDISSIKLLFSLGGNPMDGCVGLDEFFNHKVSHEIMLLKPDDYAKIDANAACLITFSKDDRGNNLPYYHTHNQLISATNIYNSLAKPGLGNKITSPFAPTSMAICCINIVSWALSDASLTCFDALMATEFQDIEINNAILCLPTSFNENNLIEALFKQGLTKLILIGKISFGQESDQSNSDIIDVTTFSEYAFIPQIRNQTSLPIKAKEYKFSILENTVQDSIILSKYNDGVDEDSWQIECSFLPINISKSDGKFASKIPCFKKLNNTKKLNIGNMLIDFSDVERILKDYHGVEDAAVLALEDKLLGVRPIMAIVPKVGAVILHHELVEFLKTKKIAPYKIPGETFKIPEIPRDYEQNTLRYTSKEILYKLVGPQDGRRDGLITIQKELASLLSNV